MLPLPGATGGGSPAIDWTLTIRAPGGELIELAATVDGWPDHCRGRMPAQIERSRAAAPG